MSDKPFTTYAQQIDKLKKDKQLKIYDEDYAISCLKKTSYFALINGYKDIFKNRTTHKYKDGVCFEDIVALYKFDEILRIILIRYILVIERQMKSLVSYCFSESYSEEQSAYLNVNNYRYNSKYLQFKINNLIQILTDTANSTEYPYIVHQRKNHGNVPLWVLINALSFGKISRMYECLRLPEQQKIVIALGLSLENVGTNALANMLSVLSKFRNVCAHNERLYNYTTKDTITNLDIHSRLHISQHGGSYKQGKNDLFAVVITMKYLLDSEQFINFFNEMEIAIVGLKFPSDIISNNDILRAMGFPTNWKEIKNIEFKK